MKDGKQPSYCKGCKQWHSAGRKSPTGGFLKFNSWCCAKGAPAKDSVGWCKTHSKRDLAV